MDAKQFLILGISFVVLVLAVLFLASNVPRQEQVEKPVQGIQGLEMTTSYIEVVEGVENRAKVFFRNSGDDIRNVRVEILRNYETRCDAPECERKDPAYDYRTTSDTLSMDDVLVNGEEDSYVFYVKPYGFRDFNIRMRVYYTMDCGNHSKEFSLPVRVTDGLVLDTREISYVPGETNKINLYFSNIGKHDIRNVRVTVEPVGTTAAVAYNQVYYSTFEGSCNLGGTCSMKEGERKPVTLNMTSEGKPEKLIVTVKYAFLDEEREKRFEVAVK